MKLILRGLMISTLLFCSAARALEPANPQANAKARAILNYFQSLSARQEKRLVSGQFTDFGRPASLRLMNEIHDQTGQWPALMGVDYADFSTGSLACKAPNQAAIEYWNQGGMVTISAHLFNPANPKGGGLRDKGVDLEALLAPGTDTHTRWMQELDLIAAGLQELKDAGVVVLWRPFHEMNGDWFWWGAKDPASFIKIWRHMFDYFSKTKGLDNLIWVYSPNHGNKTAAYYAGDPYVDLVGLDAYTDFVDTEHIKGYAELAKMEKPFGFTEYGPHGSQNPPGDYDYRRFLEGVKKDFPKAVFFMSWNWKWSLAKNNNVKEMMADPWIVNRNDLPTGLADMRIRFLSNKRIVFLGDSITQAGQYVSFTDYYLERLFPETDFDVYGLGLASETLSGLSEKGHAGGAFPRPCLFERLGRLLEKLKPGVVFACYGINDGIYMPLDDQRFASFKGGVQKLIAQCKEAGVKAIFLITPPIFDAAEKPGEFNYDSVMTAYAAWKVTLKDPGVHVIDLHTAMRKARDARSEAFSKDSIHPGDDGHLLMSKTILGAFGIQVPDEPLAAIQDDPLFKEVDLLRRQRSTHWLEHIGYTREKTVAPQPLGDSEAEERKMRLVIDDLRRRR